MKAIILISILIVTSCSIEKRLHRSGWHVEWRKKYTISQEETRKENQPLILQKANGTNVSSPILNAILKTDQDSIVAIPIVEEKISSTKRSMPNFSSILKIEVDGTPKQMSIRKSEETTKNNEKSTKSELSGLDVFVIIFSLICIILLAGGICAIIFGQHWIWLVLGILLIVLSILIFLGFLITVGLGYSVSPGFDTYN